MAIHKSVILSQLRSQLAAISDAEPVNQLSDPFVREERESANVCSDDIVAPLLVETYIDPLSGLCGNQPRVRGQWPASSRSSHQMHCPSYRVPDQLPSLGVTLISVVELGCTIRTSCHPCVARSNQDGEAKRI
jgi:hypothetical protein